MIVLYECIHVWYTSAYTYMHGYKFIMHRCSKYVCWLIPELFAEFVFVFSKWYVGNGILYFYNAQV